MSVDSPEVQQPRSRRAILAGALGGLAAAAASRFASPDRAKGAAGDPLIIGNTSNNAGTSNTSLTTSSTGTGLLVTQSGTGTALRGSAVGAGSIAGFFTAQNGTGVSGVTGNASSYGVFAQNNAANGSGGALRAAGGNNHGVVATTAHTNQEAVRGINTGNGTGVYGESADTAFSFGTGVVGYGAGQYGNGVFGYVDNAAGDAAAPANGVWGSSSVPFGAGVRGTTDQANGQGVYGANEANGATSWGVVGKTSSTTGGGAGVRGTDSGGSAQTFGVWGTTTSSTGAAVYGSAPDGIGVLGHHLAATGAFPGVEGVTFSQSAFASGVFGLDQGGSAATNGVRGQTISTAGNGVWGLAGTDSAGATGVYGVGTGAATGVWGTSTSGHGVHGTAATGIGVYATVTNPASTALYSNGNAHVQGALSVSGALSKGSGTFKIDHPLDPANKFLFHSFVESPDMLNVYSGVVTLNASGEAAVDLPGYFGALNSDIRYQLTAIEAAAPNLHVKSKVRNNRFAIAGGNPGQEVSWQVTGVRQDAYAKAHRIEVEVAKTGAEKGRYLHPVENGAAASKGIDRLVPVPDKR